MGKVAFLFPGQGSQKVGMGADLVAAEPDLKRRWFDPADEILGFELSRLCFEGPESELRRTENTQPAIFVVSLVIWDLLRRAGLTPAAAAGHSLGEYSALVCAGALEFPDGLRLVRRRGELMAGVDRQTPGAMAAVIGLSPEAVDGLCERAAAESRGVVEPANYNEPEQTVISGEEAAVEHAAAAAEADGARVVRLNVGAPFHCSLMSSVTDEFGMTLDAVPIADPTVDVVANVLGDYVRSAGEVRAALRAQVAGAVRWTDTMRRLVADGCDTFVEVGPGRVLSGFAMKHRPPDAVHSTGVARRVDRVLQSLRPTGSESSP